MKFLPSQLAYLLTQKDTRRNLGSFARYLLLLSTIIVLFTALFHAIMLNVEGQTHSWLTGLYWTLTVMTTLGFGDITFQTDLGRAFSILVLGTGVIMLLIVLPFTFIRFFYAPWIEAQIRVRAPRKLPVEQAGHVIVCHYDEVAEALISRLTLNGIPSVILQSDPTAAAGLMADGLSVMAGNVDDVQTYDNAQVHAARMVLANADDATNCNITLTVREIAPQVPIVTLVNDKTALDIIELAGANHALLMKDKLGEHLAGRVAAGQLHAEVVGRYHDLLFAEFPVHHTRLAGSTIRDTRLRELTGVNVVAYWERGRLRPALPDAILTDFCVPVVVGSQEQIASLNSTLDNQHHNGNPVLVIGGGKVGQAAIRALKQRGVAVNVIEKNPRLRQPLAELANDVTIGDAADFAAIQRAGIDHAPSVLLTANNDAINIFMAVYCRKLNPDVRIVSRITLERNLEAIHRAGADFVLSYTTLTTGYLMSHIFGREVVILGEGVDLFVVAIPPPLIGRTLGESGIGARTGLNVIALQRAGQLEVSLGPRTRLEGGGEMVMIGTDKQRREFKRLFS